MSTSAPRKTIQELREAIQKKKEDYLESDCYSPKNGKLSWNSFRWMLQDFQYGVKCFFFPHHSRLRETIPKTWMDVDYIIADFLFEALISWAEEEGGFEDWSRTEGRDPEVLERLKEIYQYALDRKTMNLKLYIPEEREKETNYLLDIVLYRGYLWV